MASPKTRTTAQRSLLKAQIAERHAQGETEASIGASLSITQQQVSYYVQQLDTEWRARYALETDLHRARVLAELTAVKQAGWRGAGIADVVEALTEALSDGDATVRRAAAQALGAVSVPDLTAILKALAQETDLLGLDAPTRAEVTGKDGGPLAVATVPDATVAAALARIAAWEADHAASD